jgi:hypothetical protein
MDYPKTLRGLTQVLSKGEIDISNPFAFSPSLCYIYRIEIK